MKTVYIKLTNACQLHCAHCYNSICPATDTMSLETLGCIKHRLENLCKLGETVHVTFHGGEPMLYPYLDEVIDFVKYFKGKKYDINFSATTNLVYPLSEQKKELFREFATNEQGKPIISTSYDYNIRFKDIDEEKFWFDNVLVLINDGFDVRPIITVTKPLIQWTTGGYFLIQFSTVGITSCNFERITCTGRASDNKDTLIPTNREVDEWLEKTYKQYKSMDPLTMHIPLFDILEDSIKFGKLSGCRARQCTCDVITFNPDGSIATCPNIADKIVGNVNTPETEEYCRMKKDLRSLENIRRSECYTCQYYQYCNGDCFQLAWDETGCPGLIKIMEDILCEHVT